MPTVIRTTTVLPGGRIDFASADLPEGRTMTVEVTVAEPTPGAPADGIFDWLAPQRPSTKTPEEWAQFERDFRAEREPWER